MSTTNEQPASLPTRIAAGRSRWETSTTEWERLDAFLATPELPAGLHRIPFTSADGTLQYEFFLRPRSGTAVLAHFHGNAPRRADDLPVITGFGVTADIDATLFIPSDATLQLDTELTLAWHTGPRWLDTHRVTMSVLDHIAAVTDAPRIVAWGGSGGGYAALRIARDMPNATAFAWNPQSNIEAYAPSAVDAYRRSGDFGEGWRFDADPRSNLATPESWSSFLGRAVIFQERSDWHLQKHLLPMLSATGTAFDAEALERAAITTIEDRLTVVVSHWGTGHLPPPKPIISHVLKDLADDHLHDHVDEWMNLILAARLLAQPIQPFTMLPSRPLEQLDLESERIEIESLTRNTVGIERTTGVQWDRDYATQRNSNVMWLYSLEYVGKLSVRAQTGDAAALPWARIAVESFIEHTREPERVRQIASIASSDHSTATRMASLLQYVQACRMDGSADIEHLADVVRLLRHWAEWLLEEANYLANNHGLMASLALLHLAAGIGPTSLAERAWEVAERRILSLAAEAFDAQGMCNENSIGYHRFNLLTYERVREFADANRPSSALSTQLGAVVERARDALARAVRQDGTIPPLGDSPVIHTGLKSINQTTWFQDSGIAFVKTDQIYLSVVCGAPSEIHKQLDDTSLTLRVGGVDVLTDSGSYAYDNSDPYRRAIASSTGHTGVFPRAFDHRLRHELIREYGPLPAQIDDVHQLDGGVAIFCRSWSERDAFASRRAILLTDVGELLVLDRIKLSAELRGTGAVQRWVLGDSLSAQPRGSAEVSLSADGDIVGSIHALEVTTRVLERGLDGEQPRGWVSETYGERVPTWVLEHRSELDESCFATVLRFQAPATRSLSDLAAKFLEDWRSDDTVAF